MLNQDTSTLFIHSASQVITPEMESGKQSKIGLKIIEQGAVLIQGDRIVDVGQTEELRAHARAQSAISLDASGCVVAPGFVDSHTHPVFVATRQEEYEMRIQGESYASIAAAGGGIRNSVRRLRAASEEQLFATARTRCAQFLAYGTTTIEAKSGYGLDLENELKILRVLRRLQQDTQVPLEIVPTFLGAHEIPDEFRNQRSKYVDLVCDVMIPRIAVERLAEFCDVFCETGVFSIDESRRILMTARRHGMKLKIHADQLTYTGGTKLAVELNAVSADHLEHIDDSDVALLSGSPAVATLLPGASFHLGMKRLPPARKLLDSRAFVALATDFNPGTSPSVNMQTILSIAGSTLHMTPAESFVAATLGGARAVGRENTLGSLDKGKQADIVIFNVDDYRLVPYHYGMNMTRALIKKGQILFDHRSTTAATVDV